MPSKRVKKADAASAKASSSSSGSGPPPAKPSWPPLKPLIPSSDLALETLLPGQIVVARKLFPASLCQRLVTFLKSLPLATTPRVPKKGEAVRVNDRFEIEDWSFAEQLWRTTALRELVSANDAAWGGEVVGLNPRIRIYRYSKGQFFDQHYDDYNLVTLPTEPATPARTTWTLLVYLTGPSTGCAGGETVFYPEERNAEPIVVAPEPGMALFHKHGNDCLLHEGRTVTAGEKWIIRSDLCVKK